MGAIWPSLFINLIYNDDIYDSYFFLGRPERLVTVLTVPLLIRANNNKNDNLSYYKSAICPNVGILALMTSI